MKGLKGYTRRHLCPLGLALGAQNARSYDYWSPVLESTRHLHLQLNMLTTQHGFTSRADKFTREWVALFGMMFTYSLVKYTTSVHITRIPGISWKM